MRTEALPGPLSARSQTCNLQTSRSPPRASPPRAGPPRTSLQPRSPGYDIVRRNLSVYNFVYFLFMYLSIGMLTYSCRYECNHGRGGVYAISIIHFFYKQTHSLGSTQCMRSSIKLRISNKFNVFFIRMLILRLLCTKSEPRDSYRRYKTM